MWLSLFMLPAPPFDVVQAEMLPIAAQLARAPAALASIYSDLSALNRYINLDKRYQPFVGWAPLHILQLWVLAWLKEGAVFTSASKRAVDFSISSLAVKQVNQLRI